MDDIIKSIVVQFPAIGILLYMLQRLYNDWSEDRKEARADRNDMLDSLYDIKHRVQRLETEAFGDRSPTLQRPPSKDDV